MKNFASRVGSFLLGAYMVGAMIALPYFNWRYAKENGFVSWILLGQIVPSAKAIVWPFFIAQKESVDRKEISSDLVVALSADFQLRDAIAMAREGKNFEDVMKMFESNPKSYERVVSKRLGEMRVEAIAVLNSESSPINGYTFYFPDASSRLVMIDAAVNPRRTDVMKAADGLIAKALETVEMSGQKSDLHFLGILKVEAGLALKVMVHKVRGQQPSDVSIRYILDGGA